MIGGTGPAVPTDREIHYAAFHGISDITGAGPLVVVHGNCQAEALRVLIAAGDVRTVRIPPVFELRQADLGRLAALLARADVLVTQPVRDDYAGLPLGSAQLAAALPAAARVLRVPIVRWTGLHPVQAIIRDPQDPSAPPPGVPYHDLRTLAAAAGLPAPRPTPRTVRAVAAAAVAELRRRESTCDVIVSDLFETPRPADMLTINHPGNRILRALAERIRRRLGLDRATVDPGRTLLTEVIAPVEDVVLQAWQLSGRGTALPDAWRVRGEVVPDTLVREVQLDWYRTRPDVVDAGLRRHRDTLQLLGFAA
ncbi:peptide ABC transporter ATPase [Nakamurella sp. YIM 132087]|uniref:Peptide ABC transporter ATPase n=1 Tax=Nakamurella alba TaxID=2665158 RepID=A0A7K1FKE0_9ACTN|nr:WcbI family polysaccharide biosynthesis putative acetyltransferase [Nakamurella alba]MTD14607.1 peptide ABC transporter ATPase [Nakamurella alba]